MRDDIHTRERHYTKETAGDKDDAYDAAVTIGRTLVAAHFMISAAGLVFAASIAILLTGFGIEPFASNPTISVLLTALAGLCIGVLAGARYRARYHQYQ